MRYIDLAEKYGHKRDHGFSAGAEFNVKVGRVDVPDFAHEQLGPDEIDGVWWTEANSERELLEEALRKRYPWIGQTMFVGRGPGWLAIEDTVGKPRNWDKIAAVVEKRLRQFVMRMEDPDFWSSYLRESGEPGELPAGDREQVLSEWGCACGLARRRR